MGGTRQTAYEERNNEKSESEAISGAVAVSTGKLPSLIAVATFVLIIASLYWAQAVLIPIALSIMLTFLLSPVAGASRTDRSRTTPFSHPHRSPYVFTPGWQSAGLLRSSLPA